MNISPNYLVFIYKSDHLIWEINENSGLASCTDGQRIGGRIEYQSQLSGSLVDNILQDNKCDLPSLDESSQMHSVFLDSMLNHWNFSQNRNDKSLPIT